VIIAARERWDITAVLEPLQLLGKKTSQINVHLHRSTGKAGGDHPIPA
jgi:hypothetical protein